MLSKITDEVKATATFALVILLGIVLSGVVFFAVEEVDRSTKTLVDRQIPALSLIRQSMAAMSEQERLLYEYYRHHR